MLVHSCLQTRFPYIGAQPILTTYIAQCICNTWSRSPIVNTKIKFLEQTCSHVAEWALSYRATEFDAIHTLCILLGTFNMDVGRGEVPIIPVIFCSPSPFIITWNFVSTSCIYRSSCLYGLYFVVYSICKQNESFLALCFMSLWVWSWRLDLTRVGVTESYRLFSYEPQKKKKKRLFSYRVLQINTKLIWFNSNCWVGLYLFIKTFLIFIGPSHTYCRNCMLSNWCVPLP